MFATLKMIKTSKEDIMPSVMQLMQAKEIRKIIVFDMKIHLKENLKKTCFEN